MNKLVFDLEDGLKIRLMEEDDFEFIHNIFGISCVVKDINARERRIDRDKAKEMVLDMVEKVQRYRDLHR